MSDTSARICTACGRTLAPGFIEDAGQSSIGRMRWIEGELEVGLFGGTRRFGRTRHDVEAHA